MGTLKTTLARMRGQRVYIDANVFIYFLARHPEHFEAVAALLQACDQGEMLGMTGDAVLAELLVKPLRDGDSETALRIRQLFARDNFLTLLPHDRHAFELAAELRGRQGAKMIDALHYATALRAGCRFFLSNDYGFQSDERMEVITVESLHPKP